MIRSLALVLALLALGGTGAHAGQTERGSAGLIAQIDGFASDGGLGTTRRGGFASDGGLGTTR